MATTSSRVQKLFASVKTAAQLNELLDALEKASVERASALGLESKGGVYVQPAGKPRTAADEPSKPTAAPKPPSEYRRLQVKAKALGINATGTKAALKARVEWAESGKPVMATAANGPSPAPAAKKRSKPAAPAEAQAREDAAGPPGPRHRRHAEAGHAGGNPGRLRAAAAGQESLMTPSRSAL
jgi:hypothetical protein